MALDFPNSPGIGSVFTDSTSGFTWKWDGTVWQSFNSAGSNTVFPSSLSTGGPLWNTDGDVTITGTGSTALLVNGNARITGILTVGTGSVTINGATNRVNVGTGLTLSSSGINVTGIITATTFSGNATTATTATNVSGGTVSGTTLTSTVATGTAPLTVTSTTKVTNLNADLLDDLTTSSSDTSGNSIVSRSSGNFSAGTITATLSGTATGLSGTPNITVGSVTASSAVVGSGTTINATGVNVTGIVTATSFKGDGSQLTNLSAVSKGRVYFSANS